MVSASIQFGGVVHDQMTSFLEHNGTAGEYKRISGVLQFRINNRKWKRCTLVPVEQCTVYYIRRAWSTDNTHTHTHTHGIHGSLCSHIQRRVNSHMQTYLVFMTILIRLILMFGDFRVSAQWHKIPRLYYANESQVYFNVGSMHGFKSSSFTFFLSVCSECQFHSSNCFC